MPAVWKRLEEAPAGQEVELALPLDADRFSGRYRGLDLRIERVTVFAQPRGALARRRAASCGSIRPRARARRSTAGRRRGRDARALRATAEVSGPAGAWKLAVKTTGGKVTELLDDLVLVFELRAKKA